MVLRNHICEVYNTEAGAIIEDNIFCIVENIGYNKCNPKGTDRVRNSSFIQLLDNGNNVDVMLNTVLSDGTNGLNIGIDGYLKLKYRNNHLSGIFRTCYNMGYSSESIKCDDTLIIKLPDLNDEIKIHVNAIEIKEHHRLNDVSIYDSSIRIFADSISNGGMELNKTLVFQIDFITDNNGEITDTGNLDLFISHVIYGFVINEDHFTEIRKIENRLDVHRMNAELSGLGIYFDTMNKMKNVDNLDMFNNHIREYVENTIFKKYNLEIVEILERDLLVYDVKHVSGMELRVGISEMGSSILHTARLKYVYGNIGSYDVLDTLSNVQIIKTRS